MVIFIGQHVFSAIPRANIQRSKFDRSHKLLTTFDVNKLIPIFCDEVLPGDTFNLKTTIFSRLSTLVAPIMDDLYIDTFFFFVPERLVFDKFQRMCGEQPNPGDSTDFSFPKLNAFTSTEGSIFDYFGIPIGVSIPSGVVRAEPFRAYNLIYNEWFRDENLMQRVPQNISERFDNASDYVLKNRCKRHDYFTSCLPWPQKGPAVDLPIGGHIPVYGNDQPLILSSKTNDIGLFGEGSGWSMMVTRKPNNNAEWNKSLSSTSGNAWSNVVTPMNPYNLPSKEKMKSLGINESPLYADLSSSAQLTINDFRQAYAVQRFYERKALGGSRYNEILRSFFGVTPPDLRLQRPEFLGGSSEPMNINTIAQTSSTDSTTPQGHLTAIGIGNNSNYFTKSFTEHGWIIGLVNVRSNNIYQQGLDRKFTRTTVFDMYWPQFAHLGEQAVMNSEIYLQGTSQDNDVFGYQERYAEYRYAPNRITGKLRSKASQSLDVWHLAQNFGSLPKLNSDFIEESVPINRVVAVKNQPNIVADLWFDLKCVRPMPLYGVPSLADHF